MKEQHIGKIQRHVPHSVLGKWCVDTFNFPQTPGWSQNATMGRVLRDPIDWWGLILSFHTSSNCDSEGKRLPKATLKVSNCKWHQLANAGRSQSTPGRGGSPRKSLLFVSAETLLRSLSLYLSRLYRFRVNLLWPL